MNYMLTWNIAPENWKATLARFKKQEEPFDGLKQIGRWHQAGTGKGFRLVETDDPVALSKLSIYWSDLMPIQIVPVVDDDEITKALGW